MIRGSSLLLAAALLAAPACRPKPAPPGGPDSTAGADTGVAADSLRPDSVRLDSAVAGPIDTTGDGAALDTVREITPADTVVFHGLLARGARPPRRRIVTAADSTDTLPPAGGDGGPALPFGFSQYPAKQWCSGTFTATVAGVAPQYMRPTLQVARQCAIHLVSVTPRKFQTTNGDQRGCWSLSKYQTMVAAYKKALPPEAADSFAAAGVFVLMGLDDMTSAQAWPGPGCTIDPAEGAQAIQALRAAYPHVPIYIRGVASYVAQGGQWDGALTGVWAQWHTGKRDPQRTYYAKNQALADRLGLSSFYGINYTNCDGGAGYTHCNADQLAQFGEVARSWPRSCAAIFWKHETDLETVPAKRTAVSRLAAAALGTDAAGPDGCFRRLP